MSEKAANSQCQTPIPTRKRAWAPGSVTPNVYSAAKRRRMSLADEDNTDFEGFGTDFGSTSKVDVVRVHSFLAQCLLGSCPCVECVVQHCGWLGWLGGPCPCPDMPNHLWLAETLSRTLEGPSSL